MATRKDDQQSRFVDTDLRYMKVTPPEDVKKSEAEDGEPESEDGEPEDDVDEG